MRHRAYIGVGSNQGDKEANCRRAVREIGGMPQTRLRQVSSWFVTEPWGAASAEWYVNGAVAVDTDLEPQTLLRHCQALEARMGRRPSPVRWADRVIDLDILFFDDMVLEEPGLTVPHPELHRRRFVLVPLCEIAPDLRHPCLDGDVRELLARVDDDKRIRERPSPDA